MPAAQAAQNVGIAAEAINAVTARLAAEERAIATDDPFFQDELVSTGAGSATRIVFIDGTELFLGQNADVTLDRFVFDAAGEESVVISITKGAMRFVSGRLDSSAYEIRTPTATLGIRGTDIDVLVTGGGRTTVFVRSGLVDLVNSIGQSVRVASGFSASAQSSGGDQPAQLDEPTQGREPEMTEAVQQIETTLAALPTDTQEGAADEEAEAEDPDEQEEEEDVAGETDPEAGDEAARDPDGDDAELAGEPEDGATQLANAPEPGDNQDLEAALLDDIGAGGDFDQGQSELDALIDAASREPPPSGALINMVAMNASGAEQAIADYMTQGNPAPKTIAVRTIALAQALMRDPRVQNPARRFDVTNMLTDVMSRSIGAPRLIQVAMDSDYTPPEGAHAFDLGGWSTPVAEGFEQLTPLSNEIMGATMNVWDQIGDGDVLQDVIAGLTNVNLPIPNGRYRVILVTSADAANSVDTPFGEQFIVNGVNYQMGRAEQSDWVRQAILGGGESTDAGVAAGIQLITEISGGELRLGFRKDGLGLGSAISGIIVEPIEAPSSLWLDPIYFPGSVRPGTVAAAAEVPAGATPGIAATGETPGGDLGGTTTAADLGAPPTAADLVAPPTGEDLGIPGLTGTGGLVPSSTELSLATLQPSLEGVLSLELITQAVIGTVTDQAPASGADPTGPTGGQPEGEDSRATQPITPDPLPPPVEPPPASPT